MKAITPAVSAFSFTCRNRYILSKNPSVIQYRSIKCFLMKDLRIKILLLQLSFIIKNNMNTARDILIGMRIKYLSLPLSTVLRALKYTFFRFFKGKMDHLKSIMKIILISCVNNRISCGMSSRGYEDITTESVQ
jgi:hypothetical protein